MNTLKFTVYGHPQQMGSKKAFVRGNRAILTDDNSKQRKQWANAVTAAAAEAMGGKTLIDKSVSVRAEFYFARPQSHYGTGRNAGVVKDSAPHAHAQMPDIDKLIRCLLDAMTGVVFRDDSRVFSIEACKLWTESQERACVEVRW